MNAALRGPSLQAFYATIFALVAANGCGKVSEAAPGAAANQAPSADPQASRSESKPSGAAPSVPSMENANYRAQIRPAGACKKDQLCATEVLVEAKGEYHINDKYPYKFKLEDPPPLGMRYPKPVVGKEDGTMDEHKVVLKVPFVSESTGAKKVSGTLSLSVCSAANCLMDKQPLEVTVKVE